MDILQGIQCGDITLKLVRPLGTDHRNRKTAKLSRQTFTLAVQIRVGNAHIQACFSNFASPGLDDNTRIVARRPVTVDRDVVPDRRQY